MATATDFRSVGASVFPSQTSEIVITKQAAMTDYAREVRTAMSQLPPDVSRDLLAQYGAPQPDVIQSVQMAIMSRELSVENMQKQVGLDQQWLASENGRRMDEVGLSQEDTWNTPSP